MMCNVLMQAKFLAAPHSAAGWNDKDLDRSRDFYQQSHQTFQNASRPPGSSHMSLSEVVGGKGHRAFIAHVPSFK